ncbi:MAG: hypothetical protein WCT44_03525 [Candidatus Paceibacterota bacterium]
MPEGQQFNGGDSTIAKKRTDPSSVTRQGDLVALTKEMEGLTGEKLTRETFIDALRSVDFVPSSTGVEISTEELIKTFEKLDKMTPEEGELIFKSRDSLAGFLKTIFGVTNTLFIRDKMVELLSTHIQG